jgi:hypothetical protein
MKSTNLDSSPICIFDEYNECYLQDVDCEVEVEDYDERFDNYEETDGLTGATISIREQLWMTNEAYAGIPIPKVS